MKKIYSKLFYALMSLCLPLAAGAQCVYPTSIATIAGSHVGGYSGDGGAGTAAQIGSPFCIAADAAGNIFIADYYNNAVRRVDNATGIITTVAGTGTAGYNGTDMAATAAQLNGPAGVTVDGAGNIYIADKLNERIRKVTAATGIITTIAGNGLHAGMPGVPFGDNGQATAAALTYPVSVALDCSGNIYIADQGSQSVRKIYANGIITTFAGNYAGGYNGDSIPATAAMLNNPACVAADCAGNVYIADSYNNRIRRVDASGIISTFAGNGAPAYSGDGGAATAASLWIPWGVTLACGNVFIGDYNNNAVRMVDAAGNIATIAGSNTRGYTGDGGEATAAAIYLPSSVAIDGSNNIYVADYGNMVIRQLGATAYQARAYVNGTTQNLTVSQDAPAVAINSLMAIPDAEAGKTEVWTVSATPLHGTLSGFPATAVSVSGITMPSSLTYTPAPGYTGDDEFTIAMYDGTTRASTTVSVKVMPNTTGVAAANNTATAGTTVMPNPNRGSFRCEYFSQADCRLDLVATDITGRVIYKETINAVAGMNSATINLPADIRRPALVMVTLGNSSVKYPVMKVTVTN